MTNYYPWTVVAVTPVTGWFNVIYSRGCGHHTVEPCPAILLQERFTDAGARITAAVFAIRSACTFGGELMAADEDPNYVGTLSESELLDNDNIARLIQRHNDFLDEMAIDEERSASTFNLAVLPDNETD